MQKLQEEEAENRKRSKWSNWESSSDDSSYSDNSDDGDDDGLNLDLAHEDVLSKEEEDRLKMLERFEFISSRLEPDELVEGFVGFEDQCKQKCLSGPHLNTPPVNVTGIQFPRTHHVHAFA